MHAYERVRICVVQMKQALSHISVCNILDQIQMTGHENEETSDFVT